MKNVRILKHEGVYDLMWDVRALVHEAVYDVLEVVEDEDTLASAQKEGAAA